jgi:uncharacterized membrane protein YedE/YeeE
MSEALAGLTAGVIFGLGLCLSGLADPAVVQGFLDFTGAWNPTLLFVMAVGLVVTFTGYRLVFSYGHPLSAARFNLPTATAIDAPLVSGAAIFGVGWGLAGYCPGPALVSLISCRKEVFIFVAAMVTGMIAARWLKSRPILLPKDLVQS